MKRIILIALFISQINFAQNTFPSVGGVGIGTSSPIQLLDVRGNGVFEGAIISSVSGDIGGEIIIQNQSKTTNGIAKNWHIFNMTGGYGNSLQFWAYDNLGCAGGGLCSNRFTLMDNGNVGIGTSNPLFKLDVNGVVNINSETDGGGLRFNSATNSQNDSRNWIVSSDGYEYGDLVFKSSSTFSGVPSDVKLTIKSNGNVGIGVKIPTNKLDVNGTIHSKEVKVDMNGWSDFVFKKEYNLPTLEQVEKHIAEKGHLENIPSEDEVLKNGINLGEMNAKLLQKIEEMTLYMIEQNKQIIDLKNRLEKVESDSK
ncbi:hypothetical protein [Flavobacterium sp. FlaQc-28]|uniref:hypothetical protein n=1 Tax=Flavobacterium sp. FlaQc-28 TaxID=3374178 RepID=UPI0037579B6F